MKPLDKKNKVKEKKIRILNIDNEEYLFRLGLCKADYDLDGYEVSYIDKYRLMGLLYLIIKKLNQIIRRLNEPKH